MKIFTLAVFLIFALSGLAQSPGQIVRPAGGTGVTLLNPNGDGYLSANSSGFSSNDISQSEIPYKIVPPAITEPTGDIATGPTGGFTDIVKTLDGSGFYTYSDGTNLFFRLRIGNIISGSKGYSILIDTDKKIGNSGPSADPNFIAATNTSNGNPGFEYEVVLETNFRVAVYAVDGTSNPGSAVAVYSLNTNSQIGVALSKDGNNPDYFYDWYIPLSAIGSPASFRMSATTVTSPSSALQGSRSDIYGIDDASGSVSQAWVTAVSSQPAVTLAQIASGGTGVGTTCTAAPTINAPILTGSNISVGGGWTRMDASKPSSATIHLYKNGVSAGTTTVSSGGSWSISVSTIAPGDVFYATAVATGESECLHSASITAGCSSLPASPTLDCASTKGITGFIPLNTTVSIYQISTANPDPFSVPLTTGLVYTNNTTNQIFNYYGTNPQSGAACQGQNGILATSTSYMLISNNNGCLSAPLFICINGSSPNSWATITSNAIALSGTVYPFHTSITGTGSASGQVLRLFINDKFVSSITASGTGFTFTGLSLKEGDNLKVYAQAASNCMSVSGSFIVSCYLSGPVISTNTSGNLLSSSTSVSGSSASSGATVNLYRGTYPSGSLVGTTTASATGSWTVSSLTLTAGESYYAIQTAGGCTSQPSAAATVLGPTVVCPVFTSGSFAQTASSITGTMSSFTGTIRLYQDGVLIGSSSVTSASTWSISVNTNYSNSLYAGGQLTVTAQTSGAAENTACGSTASVTCVAPLTPTVSPLNATIFTGENLTYTVSNVQSNTWYAVMDNTGSSFATSVYSTASGNINLPTNTFGSQGTYSLKVSADALSGCAASIQNTVVTVNFLTLAVNFISVEAEKKQNSVLLSWIVDNEKNVSTYEVERSSDCRHFSKIAAVPYHKTNGGPATYQYNDVAATEDGTYCYRIRQVDSSGRNIYSKVVSARNSNAFQWSVAPNPVTSNAVVSIHSLRKEHAELSLLSGSGNLIYRRPIGLIKGDNAIMLNEFSGLPSGTYILTIRTQKELLTKKVLKKASR
jgi:hypothetical protein